MRSLVAALSDVSCLLALTELPSGVAHVTGNGWGGLSPVAHRWTGSCQQPVSEPGNSFSQLEPEMTTALTYPLTVSYERLGTRGPG